MFDRERKLKADCVDEFEKMMRCEIPSSYLTRDREGFYMDRDVRKRFSDWCAGWAASLKWIQYNLHLYMEKGSE